MVSSEFEVFANYVSLKGFADLFWVLTRYSSEKKVEDIILLCVLILIWASRFNYYFSVSQLNIPDEIVVNSH